VNELAWRTGLDSAESAAVRDLAAAATAADGVAPLSEHVLLHLGEDHPGPDTAAAVHLLATSDSTLAGIAHLDPDGTAELTVHPTHRRTGLGTAMVRTVSARVPAGRPLRFWAHGSHPAAAVLADRLEYTVVRELLQLRLALTEPPAAPDPPPGVRIRTFRVGADEAELIRVNNAAFAWHPEQGGWSVADVERREDEPWFDPAGFLLAVDDADRLLGYHWTKVHPPSGDTGELGEVYVLGVDPAAHGKGLGRALLLAGLRHLHDRGLRTVTLYVEGDNAAALRLYDVLGFTRWRADVLYARR
jgi:mycothiol synthase